MTSEFNVFTFSEYIETAKKTALRYDENIFLFYSSLGLCGEVGELVEKLFSDNTDKDSIKGELGDICWYYFITMSKLGFTPEDIFETNNIHEFISTNEDYNHFINFTNNPSNVKGIFENIVYYVNTSMNKIKKIWRDTNWELSEKSRLYLQQNLKYAGINIFVLCEFFDIDILDVLNYNLDKLNKRLENNTIHGDGDNR